MIRTAILGASGYVGGELLRLLAAHPEFAPAKLFGDSKAGQALRAVHPHLAAAYPHAIFEEFDEASLDGVDLVFAALPHGHSQRLAANILDQGIKFVDLGADFRLDDAVTYERWYGHEHEAPELLDRFVYGIPELNREAIRSADAVAAAGCYATAAILALKPLVDAGLVKRTALSSMPHRESAAPAAEPRKRPLSALSTAASRPTGCSATATRPKWRWRSAARCCSHRISCR